MKQRLRDTLEIEPIISILFGMLLTSLVAGCARLGVTSTAAAAPSDAQARPPDAQLARLKAESDQQNARIIAAWAPVEKAIQNDDPVATQRALAAYERSGNPMFDGFHIEAARFFARHGDLKLADAELAPVVHRNITKAPRSYDPRDCLFWLDINKSASRTSRDQVVQTWADGFRAEHGGPKDLAPEALLEFEAGQYYMAAYKNWGLAADHFKKALKLAPNSSTVQIATVWALRSTHHEAEAKRIALAAAASADSETTRTELLLGAGINSPPRGPHPGP